MLLPPFAHQVPVFPQEKQAEQDSGDGQSDPATLGQEPERPADTALPGGPADSPAGACRAGAEPELGGDPTKDAAHRLDGGDHAHRGEHDGQEACQQLEGGHDRHDAQSDLGQPIRVLPVRPFEDADEEVRQVFDVRGQPDQGLDEHSEEQSDQLERLGGDVPQVAEEGGDLLLPFLAVRPLVERLGQTEQEVAELLGEREQLVQDGDHPVGEVLHGLEELVQEDEAVFGHQVEELDHLGLGEPFGEVEGIVAQQLGHVAHELEQPALVGVQIGFDAPLQPGQ